MEENREKERESGRKRGMGAWKRGDGVQRMQRQSYKMGRLLTSHCDTDKVKREERRLTLTAHPGLCSASAKWLLLTEFNQQLSPDSLWLHLAEGDKCE